MSNDETSRPSYDWKHRIIPKILPALVPTVGVPASLLTAWTFHLWQGARLNYLHLQNRKATPTVVPEGAGGVDRSQDEAVSRMNLQDYDPWPIDGYTSTGLKSLPDIAPMYFDSGTKLRGRLHRYPRHFHETLIPVRGGTPISAILGMHHAKLKRPGLIVVHGLLNSKRQDLVRIVTLRAFYEWGFNVCAFDLRGFGRSVESASIPNAGGGVEALDILDISKYLRQFPHFRSIGVLGFSLGAATVLNAGSHKDAPALLDGGIMAVCPPLDYDRALKRLDKPPDDENYLVIYHFFRFLFQRMLSHAEFLKYARKKLPNDVMGTDVATFTDYLRLVAWGYYGEGRDRTRHPDQLIDVLKRFNSPQRAIANLKVPTFILTAKDDPVTQIDASDIEYLTRAAAKNPNLRFLVTELGGHTAYNVLDPDWFYAAIRAYFTYWADWGKMVKTPPNLKAGQTK